MDDPLSLFISMMLGVLGTAWLVYGWRQRHIMATFAGMGVTILVMASSNPVINLFAGAAMLSLPFLLRF